MTDEQKQLDYYKSGLQRRPPAFVPKRILVLTSVHGDGPFSVTRVSSGEYECESNPYGAISVKATNGHLLGLKPDEFEVTEWAENPHLNERDPRRRYHGSNPPVAERADANSTSE